MNGCKFIEKFNKLRKSSSNSIDNIQIFDDFRKYMHVIRATEMDLKKILSAVNSSGKKTLVLLCGSAGDGKSHLLSYLKNSDPDHLIDGYSVFNDATESNAPDKTAVETLCKRLEDFNDDNIGKPGSNAIIAINLGVLSNFIESEWASNFSLLRKYVKSSNIMTSEVTTTTYVDNSNFQHISFSDYHKPSETKSLFELLQGVVVIDMSGYDPDIQSLIVAITLDLFYSQMQAAGSSKMDGQYRQLTKMILVDEADNFMSEGFPSLKKILKEGREFGVGTILSTQFLKHFGSGDDDYSKYILTWIVHNVSDLKNSDVDFVFHTEPKSSESNMLFNRIKGLEKHHSLVAIGTGTPIYLHDKAFWKLYSELKDKS